MSVVVCKELVKRFGSQLAVDHVNVDIPDGEFMVFVGPSGCGKTTTLRMIGGLETVTAGDICIDDQRVNHLAPRQRDIAMVFQNYALYPHYKVFDNIAYPLRLRKLSKAEIKQRVNTVANMLGVQQLLDRWPRQLSGGERQRVALGRAIVRDPKLYLMDEPLSNLDAKLRVQMRREIIRLQRKLSTTTIYVTHDQVEAMTMGDRIMVMRAGSVQQIGAPEVLYNQPANLFVAQFIGSPAMNAFKARLESTGGEVVVATDFGRFPLDERLVSRLKPDGGSAGGPRQVICGIRPEDISVNSDTPGPASPQANVDLVEDLGADAYVSLAVGGVTLIARMPADSPPHENQKVTMHLNPHKIQLFDVGTETTLLNQGAN
jgi:multiple sugar transport system ATP-binding protein